MFLNHKPSSGQYLQRLILLIGLYFFGLLVLTFLAAAAAVKIYNIPCEIYNLFEYIKLHPYEERTINALIFTQVMSQIMAMAMPFLIVMQITYREEMFAKTGLITFPKALVICLILILFAATLYPQQYLELWNGKLFEPNPEQFDFIQAMIKADNSNELIINVLFMALLPAVCEELFFRGGVYFLLRKLTGKIWLPAIASSLFFAFVHQQPSQMIVIFLMGMMLAFLFEFTNSIWANILLHFVNNTFFVVCDYMKWDIPFEAYSAGSILALVISVGIIVAIFYYLYKRKPEPSICEDNFTEE